MLDQILDNVSNLKKVSECINSGIRLSLHGLELGEKSLVIHYVNKKAVIVCSSLIELDELKISLTSLGHKVGVLTYGISSPIFSYKEDNSLLEFIKNIFDFKNDKIDFLLILSETLLQRLPDESFFNKTITMQKNASYNFENLQNVLVNLGYKRCDYVTKKGEFAIRGDIVDIYPTNDDPVRLDFFGDELEKISLFDIDTMKSYKELDSIVIYPATIFFIDDKNKLLNLFNEEIKKIKINNDNYSKINEIISTYLVRLNNNNLNANDGFILPFFDFKDNILSLLKNNLIYLSEPKKIIDDFNLIYNNNLSSLSDLINKGELAPIHKNFYFNFLENKLDNYCIFENISNNHFDTDKSLTFRTIGSRKYLFNYKTLCSDINIYLASNYKIFLFCGSDESAKSIGTYLIQNNISYQDNYNPKIPKGQVIVSKQTLEHSASFLESNIILIGTGDLVKRVKKVETKTKRRASAYLPKIGDLVVHTVHGIGKCVDIKKLNLNGSEKDYFLIEYKGGDILYVPSEQANLISAFLGSDKQPKLNKIGGVEFGKIKDKVKSSVKELAINLVELYSKRDKLKGHIYESGNYLMDEFENAFSYELTYDQMEAIKDIKNDLYSGKIMDRLICGDVGYGKTEVALRAAYQVVLEGKQVAFLCPTTILSEQHYKTTVARTKDFMCKVQVLNRFKTKQQTEQILKDLKEGNVDIIIGTHRLLSDDVVFKDLGLLILDEEHRFGVEDKEKIKNLKKDIGVLTLSATPIPRTLNMAMTGIRDISLIETAPKNRLPVQTFVTPQSDALIEDAIHRELARGGQVLVVFNRVDKIYDFCEHIKELAPSARVGLAHGQMPEKLLEDTILKLYNGEFDVLVATTLIENGIDLPMANTLIVIDADRLGLSQLYQLKGRIGRSDRLAYAYFTFNPNKILTEDAYKRLDAIMEFSELGSGFKIAMRDLEIRGAGNVLGKEQHGHMEKVGYDLYCKILEQTVSEIRGEKKKEKLECKIDISCPAYLNENYIKGDEERIKQYSQISDIDSMSALNELKQETVLAYGKMPSELENLYKIALIKNLCINLGAKKLLCNATTTKIYLYKRQDIIPPKCAEILNQNKDIAVLKFEDVPIIELNLNNLSMQNKLDFLIKFLNDCIND